MRLAVIGNKDFTDYKRLKNKLDEFKNIDLIISGAAPGTDTLAAKYAHNNKIDLLEFPPDYNQFGQIAKYKRDEQIVENCDQIIAFWDGKCEGTKYTLDYAKKLGKKYMIINLNLY